VFVIDETHQPALHRQLAETQALIERAAFDQVGLTPKQLWRDRVCTRRSTPPIPFTSSVSSASTLHRRAGVMAADTVVNNGGSVSSAATRPGTGRYRRRPMAGMDSQRQVKASNSKGRPNSCP